MVVLVSWWELCVSESLPIALAGVLFLIAAVPMATAQLTLAKHTHSIGWYVACGFKRPTQKP